MLLRTKTATILLLVLLFLPFLSSSQETPNGDTYAIVVGISKYHYIKALSYADKDADLFAELLRSGAGGSIKPGNLFLLKNDSANAGNFWSALSRISNKRLGKGDRVFIYFAGHGDAVKGLNEYYLLLSDCQPANDGNNYMLSFGAIDMYHLKNRIGLLTRQGVEVVLILDACRTNELAGGYASQVFTNSIVQTQVGEIAMLATGPGQVSIEDKSFGSGHGLFTYDLVDAWSGRADAEIAGNRDKRISLEELRQWVTQSVVARSEKFRVKQKPVFCCDDRNTTTIGKVDSSFHIAWNRLKELNKGSGPVMGSEAKTPRSNSGMADTSLLALYNSFIEARKENKLWGPGSADDLYEKMKAGFPNEPITEDARYTLASDFINFAQQKVNLYLEGKDILSIESLREKLDSAGTPGFLSDEYERMQHAVSEKWTIAGRMVEKAGKLLSSKNDSTLFYQLKPRIAFLLARGYVNKEVESDLGYNEALKYSLEAYKLDSNAAYTAECLGLVYVWRQSFERMFGPVGGGYEMGAVVKRSDTAMRYFRKAISLAPKWASPYRSIGIKIYGMLWGDTALVYLHQARQLSPEDATTYIMIGDVYRQWYPDSAMMYYRKGISLSGRSSLAMIYRKMARVFLEGGYVRNSPRFKPDSVLYYSQLALNAESNSNIHINSKEVLRDVYTDLAGVYGMQEKSDSAVIYYKKVIALFPDHRWSNISIIAYYRDKNRMDSLVYYSRRYMQLAPKEYFPVQELAHYHDRKGAKDSAIWYYEKVIAISDLDLPRERLAYLLMAKDKNNNRAFDLFMESARKFPSGWRPYFNVACYFANKGDTVKALEYLDKTFRLGMKNRLLLDTDPFISTLKDNEAFKALVTKYFAY